MKQAEFYFTFEIRLLARVTYENLISLPEKKERREGTVRKQKKNGYSKENNWSR